MPIGDIEYTPLWQDVKATVYSGPKQVKFDYFVMVHTEQGDFNVFKLITLEDECDYANMIGSNVNLQFQVGLGDYLLRLYPFRANLEVSIKKVPQLETGGTDMEKDVSVVRYKAILKPGKNVEPTGTRITDHDYQTLNTSNLVDVFIELQDRNFEPLRLKTFPGGTFTNLTVKDIMTVCVFGESKNVLVDGAVPVDGIDIVEPDNTARIPYLIMPNMKAAMIPTYLQERSLGVYNAGLGTFYQRYKDKSYWYIYSLFNPERFDEDVDRMVFFAMPKERFPGIDRTYRQEGKITYVVVTGDRGYTDSGDLTDVNEGIGFRMPDANAMMKKPVVMTEQGPKADRARLNTEVAGRKRADGNIFAPVVTNSANPYRLYSQLACRQLARVDVVWENSDPDLIYPGMPCKYVFMDKEEYKELKGIIVYKYSCHSLVGRPVVSSTYRTSTQVTIMLEQFMDPPPEQPTMNAPGKF